MTVRIGLLGAGFVSTFYLQGLVEVPGQEIKVVYSRTQKRGQEFARKWAFPRSRPT